MIKPSIKPPSSDDEEEEESITDPDDDWLEINKYKKVLYNSHSFCCTILSL